MGINIMKWSRFGFGIGLISSAIMLILITLLGGVLASVGVLGELTSVAGLSMAQLIGGTTVVVAIFLVMTVLVSTVMWSILGVAYEFLLRKMLRSLSIFYQLTIVSWLGVIVGGLLQGSSILTVVGLMLLNAITMWVYLALFKLLRWKLPVGN